MVIAKKNRLLGIPLMIEANSYLLVFGFFEFEGCLIKLEMERE